MCHLFEEYMNNSLVRGKSKTSNFYHVNKIIVTQIFTGGLWDKVHTENKIWKEQVAMHLVIVVQKTVH